MREDGEATLASRLGGERRILVVVLDARVTEFDLVGGELTVGRSSEAEVYVDDASVSRAHARIRVQDGRVTVRDLGSKNGTYVNGAMLGDADHPVAPGDALRFGDVVAQLRAARSSKAPAARLVSTEVMDARIAHEAERCERFHRPIAAIAVEVADGELAAALPVIDANLRALDALTRRTRRRVDILAVECNKPDAIEMASRIHARLRACTRGARVGVAAYPDDVPSVDSLLVSAKAAMRAAAPERVGVAREGARVRRFGRREVIVADPAMTALFAQIERVAGTSVPVLIEGETGSGKEIAAEALHALGPRAAGRLVVVNCAAVPEHLLESEIFGHEKGAFTDATTSKPGLLEEADRGTLFFDEIGELAPALQAKLLRVIEEGCVRRLGATRERQVSVRFVAATHRDLRAAAEAGQFRQDLFFRLGAVVLRVPPLRERPRDLALLAERFMIEACRGAGRDPIAVSPAVMRALAEYDWPGNVRELRNVVHAAVVMCDGPVLEARHLPAELAELVEPASRPPVDAPRPPLDDELRALERERITEALAATAGNQTAAARMLGMPRSTLISRMAALGIDAPRQSRR